MHRNSTNFPSTSERRSSMKKIRARLFIGTVIFGLALATQFSVARAQMTKIKIGRTTGASGFHLPSYVAMDKGFLKGEGLDAVFIAATGGVLVRASIAKELEF